MANSAPALHRKGQLPIPAPYGLGALRKRREPMLYGVEHLRLGEDHLHPIFHRTNQHAAHGFVAVRGAFGEGEALFGFIEGHGGDDCAERRGSQ